MRVGRNDDQDNQAMAVFPGGFFRNTPVIFT